MGRVDSGEFGSLLLRLPAQRLDLAQSRGVSGALAEDRLELIERFRGLPLIHQRQAQV